MMTRLLCLLAVLSLVPVQAGPLSPDQAAALRADFQKHWQQTKLLAVPFTQTVTMPGLRQPIVSTGTLAYRAPEELRLDFTQPAGEFVLVLGDRLYLQKTGKRVAVKSLSQDNAGKPFRSLLGLLRGQLAETETQYTAEILRVDQNWRVVLTRKRGASGRGPERITNTIGTDTFHVREILVELATGGTIHFAFGKPQAKQTVPDNLFIPPAVGR